MTTTEFAPRPLKYQRLLALVAGLIFAVYFLIPPITIMDKTGAIGYAICHQIPARTIHIDGTPLPLCARCTGIYLGALMGIVGLFLLRRYHAVEFPPLWVLLTLVSFIGIMGIDGINSFVALITGEPILYEPQNWLRLTTGTFHGLAMSVILCPVFNVTLWQPQLNQNRPVLQNFKELWPFLGAGLVIILLVWWQHPLLLYPIAILSTMGILLMLGMVNTALFLIITRRERYASRWQETWLPVTMGLALSFVMIGGIDWLRYSVTQAAGLPF